MIIIRFFIFLIGFIFSLILILGIYYVSIDDEVKAVLKTESEYDNKEVIEISESDILVSLEVEKELYS